MGDLNYKGPRQPRNLRPFSIKQGRATLEAGPKKVVGHLGPEGEEEAAKLQPRIASRAQARGPPASGKLDAISNYARMISFALSRMSSSRIVVW